MQERFGRESCALIVNYLYNITLRPKNLRKEYGFILILGVISYVNIALIRRGGTGVLLVPSTPTTGVTRCRLYFPLNITNDPGPTLVGYCIVRIVVVVAAVVVVVVLE